MDHLPPVRVQKIGSPDFPRFVLRDGAGRYWALDGWCDTPNYCALFAREIDAIATKNRYCLEKVSDTFVTSGVICVRADDWNADELAAWLQKHGRFYLPGPPGKKGMTLEFLPSSVRKVNDAEETADGTA